MLLEKKKKKGNLKTSLKEIGKKLYFFGKFLYLN